MTTQCVLCYILQLGQTPLHKAAATGKVVIIEYLLNKRTKIDHEDHVRYLMCILKHLRYNHMCMVYTVCIWDKNLQYINGTSVVNLLSLLTLVIER